MSTASARAAAVTLTGVLVLYAAGVVLLSGVLAVPLFGGLASAGAAGFGFHRTVYRLAELLALLGLVPLLALTGGAGRAAWGYAAGRRAAWLRELGIGFAAGLGMLGALALVLVAVGARVVRPDLDLSPAWLAGVVGKAALAALLIALLEETWFRGGLHTLCERLAGPLAALAACSAIYAVLHFVRPPSLPDGVAPGPLDGLRLFGASTARLWEPETVGPLLALAAAGTLLGLARLETGRIAACVGLHAGWVVVIKVLKKCTHLAADPGKQRLVEGYDGVIGWLAALWLGALALAYGRRVLRARSAREPRRSAEVSATREPALSRGTTPARPGAEGSLPDR